MIKKSKQDWTKGKKVNVGFNKGLLIIDIKAVHDGKPDIYILKNEEKNIYYEFIPHWGIQEINYKEEMENVGK